MSHSFTYSILIHYSEIALKLNNRAYFEKKFINNIKLHINGLRYSEINLTAARVFINDINIKDWDYYKDCLKNVMGLKNALLMQKVDAEINLINNIAYSISQNVEFNTFRITTKRQDKGFSLTSHEVNQIIGADIYKKTAKSVSLKNPDFYLKKNALLVLFSPATERDKPPRPRTP